MLAIIVPVLNEEAVLPSVLDRLTEVLGEFAAQRVSGRVVFVDDGSSDRTRELIRNHSERDPRFGFIGLSRNFGHQVAVSAGIREVDADLYAIIDGDLQDPPELLPAMIGHLDTGADVVYGVRATRRESAALRTAYWAFYRLLQRAAYLDIPLDAGDFCVMNRTIVDAMRSLGEHRPFVRGLRSWVGFSQVAFPYDRDARAAGEVKYTLRKLIRLAGDGLLSFSYAPLRLITLLGIAISTLAVVGVALVIALKLVWGIPLQGWASLVAIMLFLGGVQTLSIGVVAEYLARVFEEAKGRPLYVVSERAGLGNTIDEAGVEPEIVTRARSGLGSGVLR